MNVKLLTFVLMLVIPASLPGRELKSEDGSKTMNAEFVRYVPSRDMVTLSQGVGTNPIVVPASRFSQEDRDYFVEAQKEIDKKQAFKINIDPNNERSKETQGAIVVSYRTSQYAFEVTNTSESYFDGLELRYWIVYEEHDPNSGDPTISMKSESRKLMPLAGGAAEIIEAPAIKLTLGAKTAGTCNCPTARARQAAKAGAVERDRILGTKVELVDSNGEVIYSEVSSNRVRALFSEEKNG